MLRFSVLAATLVVLAACTGTAETTDVSSAAVETLSPAFFDPGLPPDAAFPRANPDPAKVDVAALQRLLARAAASESEAVVIAQDDVIIAEKYFGHVPQRRSVQSVTKSVVSLAIGALIDEGRIDSVDAPVSTFFPEWSAPPRSQVTLRQLLTMTGGIEDSADFWQHDDLLGFARRDPLTFTPGTVYRYSNESSMLFAGVVQHAAGMPIDRYVEQRFFAPLGITGAYWAPDQVGTPQTPGGLYLSPRDLLRLGTLARHGGEWQGQRLVSAAWTEASAENQTPLEKCYGFLWWVVREGCDGYHFAGPTLTTPIEGFFADGWGGNYVAVIPSSRIVAIRTKMPDPPTPEEELRTRYLEFTRNVVALAPTR